MLGLRLGAYRVEAELGSGGMGTVYRAKVEQSAAGLRVGQGVALKVLHPHLLAVPGLFKRFLREADVGKRVAHENVVSTFDMDAAEADGHTALFLAMELVEGRTLRDMLQDLGRVPEGLLREIARQAAAGLAAIHAEGIVHRDLKPENILVTQDHKVRIMDLGVARIVEETAVLTQEGQFAGSLLWAAPEQFTSDPVGPAADLYSLGVLLFELATGANPFRRDDAAAVIRAHLEEVPPRANEVQRDVSTFLTEVLHTLLAKESGGRFESAAALLDVLREQESSAWWAARERSLLARRTRRPRVPVRVDFALQGREAETRALAAAWERALGGEGCSVFFEGEAGIGKTRLIDAFLKTIATGDPSEDVHVLYGAFSPSGGQGAVSDAVVDHFGATRLEEALRPYLAVTPSLVASFAALLQHDTPPPGAQTMEGDALHAVAVQLMHRLASERPVVWVVDDLQFGEAEQRKLVLSLARAVEGHRVLLLGTMRPGLPHEELSHFSMLPNFERLPLPRLAETEVTALLTEALGSDALADRLAGDIARRSDGIPFFVLEMLRNLKEQEYVTARPDGEHVETRPLSGFTVPTAIRDLITARLELLARDERHIVDMAAVDGFRFDSGLVATALGLDSIPALRTLAEIERRTGVVRARGREHVFDHHQIQEVLYEGLPEALRAEYHTALAHALAGRVQIPDGPDGVQDLPGETAARLATHHLRGRDARAAGPYLASAVEHLKLAFRSEALLDLIARALEVPGLLDDSTRVRFLLEQVGVYTLLGRTEEARRGLDEATDIATRLDREDLRLPVLESRGYLGMLRGDFDGAARTLTEGIDRARRAGDGRGEARLLALLADIARQRGRFAEAREHLRRRLDLEREAGDPTGEMGSLAHLGIVAFSEGAYDEARRMFEQSVDHAQRTGDLQGEANASGNLGLLCVHLGEYDEARRRHERHLELARRIGDRGGESRAHGNLGNLEWSLGRFEAAREHYEKNLRIAREVGARPGEANATGSLGSALWGLGRIEEAETLFRRYLELAEEIGDRQGSGIARLDLGPLQRLRGDPEEAEATLDAARETFVEIGARRYEGYALLESALASHARGDDEEARVRATAAGARWREIGYRRGQAKASLLLGQLDAAAGDPGAAATRYVEALDVAKDLGLDDVVVLAEARRALLPDGDVLAAREAFEQRSSRLGFLERMEARHLLGRATGDPTFVEGAWRDLERLRAHMPPASGDAADAFETVPLHRAIRDAWEARAP